MNSASQPIVAPQELLGQLLSLGQSPEAAHQITARALVSDVLNHIDSCLQTPPPPPGTPTKEDDVLRTLCWHRSTQAALFFHRVQVHACIIAYYQVLRTTLRHAIMSASNTSNNFSGAIDRQSVSVQTLRKLRQQRYALSQEKNSLQARLHRLDLQFQSILAHVRSRRLMLHPQPSYLMTIDEEEVQIVTKHKTERQRLITQIQAVSASEAACYSREVELNWQQQQQQAGVMSAVQAAQEVEELMARSSGLDADMPAAYHHMTQDLSKALSVAQQATDICSDRLRHVKAQIKGCRVPTGRYVQLLKLQKQEVRLYLHSMHRIRQYQPVAVSSYVADTSQVQRFLSTAQPTEEEVVLLKRVMQLGKELGTKVNVLPTTVVTNKSPTPNSSHLQYSFSPPAAAHQHMSSQSALEPFAVTQTPAWQENVHADYGMPSSGADSPHDSFTSRGVGIDSPSVASTTSSPNSTAGRPPLPPGRRASAAADNAHVLSPGGVTDQLAAADQIHASRMQLARQVMSPTVHSRTPITTDDATACAEDTRLPDSSLHEAGQFVQDEHAEQRLPDSQDYHSSAVSDDQGAACSSVTCSSTSVNTSVLTGHLNLSDSSTVSGDVLSIPPDGPPTALYEERLAEVQLACSDAAVAAMPKDRRQLGNLHHLDDGHLVMNIAQVNSTWGFEPNHVDTKSPSPSPDPAQPEDVASRVPVVPFAQDMAIAQKVGSAEKSKDDADQKQQQPAAKVRSSSSDSAKTRASHSVTASSITTTTTTTTTKSRAGQEVAQRQQDSKKVKSRAKKYITYDAEKIAVCVKNLQEMDPWPQRITQQEPSVLVVVDSKPPPDPFSVGCFWKSLVNILDGGLYVPQTKDQLEATETGKAKRSALAADVMKAAATGNAYAAARSGPDMAGAGVVYGNASRVQMPGQSQSGAGSVALSDVYTTGNHDALSRPSTGSETTIKYCEPSEQQFHAGAAHLQTHAPQQQGRKSEFLMQQAFIAQQYGAATLKSPTLPKALPPCQLAGVAGAPGRAFSVQSAFSVASDSTLCASTELQADKAPWIDNDKASSQQQHGQQQQQTVMPVTSSGVQMPAASMVQQPVGNNAKGFWSRIGMSCFRPSTDLPVGRSQLHA